MGLLRPSLLGFVVFLATTRSVQAAFVNLQATVVYDSKDSCTGTSTSHPLIVTAVASTSTCTESTNCFESPTGSSLYPATVCSVTDGTSNGDFLTTTLPYLYGSSPYVVVETYAAGKSCSTLGFENLTAYLADGKCHQSSGSASYKATRNADRSATILTYKDVMCGTSGTQLTVTAAQATGNSCTADVNGILDKKVYGAGITSLDSSVLYLSSILSYDTAIDSCKSPGVPLQVVTTTVAANTCTSTSSCTGSAPPFSGISCSSTLTYKDEISTLFGSNAYMIVEKYTPGFGCNNTKLSEMIAYLADDLCHKTGASTSYRAMRSVEGAATIKTYSDSANCATTGSTLSVTATQAAGNSCTTGANGILDMKVYGSGRSFYLTQVQSYDSNTDNCKPPGQPIYVTTASVAYYPGSCTPSTSCSNSVAPFTGTTCGSPYSFKMDMAVTFGSNPYVIVEVYIAGTTCDRAKLAGMTAYVADGKCHKTGTANSYIATRTGDGSAIVKLYWSAECTGTSAPLVDVSATQAKGNSCTEGPNGILDKKIYGAGATPMYLQSVLNFDTNTGGCKSPTIPTSVTTERVASLTACVPTMVCSGNVDPYTGTSCGTYSSFQADASKWFGTQPYLVVESYTAGSNCAGTKLSSLVTYMADGKCHKIGTGSYEATRTGNGAAIIKTYTNADCEGTPTMLDVTAAQAKGNSCAMDMAGILDKKIYGAGESTLYLASTLVFDSNSGSCTYPAIPTSVTTTLSTECISTAACTNNAWPFTRSACTYLITSFKDEMEVFFGESPFVIVEKYNIGKACAITELVGITTYLAGDRCHRIGSMSYRALRRADGSATIKTYMDDMCITNATVLDISASQAAGNSCNNDGNGISDTKVYGNGVEEFWYLSSVLNYETTVGDCKPPAIPTQVSTIVTAGKDCTESSSCTGTATPYTGSACSTTLTYTRDMADRFRANPFIIVQRYRSGKSCRPEELVSLTTFLADNECHKTGTTASYKAVRKADGAIVIHLFTDSSGCDTIGATLAMTAMQVLSNSCADDGFGMLDTKVYAFVEEFLSTTAIYNTKMNNCKLPAMPTQLIATIVDNNLCQESSSCTGESAPYNGTICSSRSSYEEKVAAVFGANPYVIVENYNSGTNCGAALSTIGTYFADTKCHRSSPTSSFRAIRKTDGSATIMTYANSGSCANGPATLAVTTEQALGNECVGGRTGIVDAKVYGGGATPLFLTVTAVFDSNANGCKLPATPVQWVATTLSVDMCTPSVGCRFMGPSYTNTVCSSTRTYFKDVSTAFSWNSTVTVQRFIAGKSCSDSALASITTYLADYHCHSSSSTSFVAILRYDGSVELQIYTNSAYCSTVGSMLSVTAAQIANNECISTGVGDMKVTSS